MLEQVHFAVQYLAMAGKSFLKPRPDDSHTNLAFNATTHAFETWPLDGDGLKLTFDVPNFQLKWSTGAILDLVEKNHAQVTKWVTESSPQTGIDKPYVFDLHYELPFLWNAELKFEQPDPAKLKRLVQLRILANNVLDTFLKKEKLESAIRIWPHHFDTGAFVVLADGSEKSIGMGMAIPDTLVNDHYFYLSAYHGHAGIDTSNFSALAHGEWKNDGFKGAILPTSEVSTLEAVQFLQEALGAYPD